MRKKTFTKGDDTYIICPYCGAIYNAEVKFCPGCLYNLKLDYSPKKKRKKKLTKKQIERRKKWNKKYAKRKRERKQLWMLRPENLDDFCDYDY